MCCSRRLSSSTTTWSPFSAGEGFLKPALSTIKCCFADFSKIKKSVVERRDYGCLPPRGGLSKIRAFIDQILYCKNFLPIKKVTSRRQAIGNRLWIPRRLTPRAFACSLRSTRKSSIRKRAALIGLLASLLSDDTLTDVRCAPLRCWFCAVAPKKSVRRIRFFAFSPCKNARRVVE